ncbi:putative pre-mRNA-processing factor 19 [[Candida] jaroonii]|uniref:Pre-mRNA-processing factor 19 n=1 Tax=[Candida] jaroonii TaxID=467808 RepID=A0ACA9Y7B8_9ASCO|nr:putative pre-mRNA-processing factor 19 [[Candida] jaroonii]
MLCSLTGEICQEPVVSPRSGKIFERKSIENYLSTNSTDPINDQPLTINDLIPIDTDVTIPPRAQSIPSMLRSFQNEFDSMALEIFTLRKQLNKAKEELSSSLYHYDAAVKVAANAIKERDEVKRALQELSASIGDGVMEEESQNGEPSEIKALIEESRAQLFALHKSQKFTLPATTPTFSLGDSEDIDDFKFVYYDDKVKKLILGGKSIIVKDLITKEESKISHKGILTALNMIEYNGSLVPIYGNKNAVKFDEQTIKFKGNVVDIKSHPKLKSLYVVMTTKSFSLFQETEKIMEIETPATTGEFHVDGALFAIGGDNEVLVYDLTKDQEPAATIPIKYPTITKITFGFNGYWLLVSSTDGTNDSIEFIDLRKSTVIHTIDVPSLKDFIIDKSCSYIITLSDKIDMHKYTKKGKIFQDFVDSIEFTGERIFLDSSESIQGFLISDKLTNYKLDF